jgi:hypothetical protein
MNKEDIKFKIKDIIKGIYSQGQFSVPEKFYKGEPFQEEFYFLGKFPKLKKVIIELFTDTYSNFINDIHWVAPIPTTFKIVLNNNQYFYIINTNRSWIAQIEGKKYYLLNLNEAEKASEAIAHLLRYPNPETTKSNEDSSTEEETPEEPEAEDTTPEETPEA